MRPSHHIRPMAAADLRQVADLTAAAFGRDLGDDAARRRWDERIAYPLSTDPGGAFVAEVDGRVIGVAQAIVRERLWCLSMLAVAPNIQSAGVGHGLVARALTYGDAAQPGLIVSSNDTRALRLYARAGFALRPSFKAEGIVDRRALPRSNHGVTDDDGGDLEAFAALARAIRGAPYTSELRFALGRGARLLRSADRGFAVVADAGLWLLVASDEESARMLLWHALAFSDGPTCVRWITAEQQWAIDVLVHAGLRLDPHGALCVRGAPGPLRPFLPTPSFA